LVIRRRCFVAITDDGTASSSPRREVNDDACSQSASSSSDVGRRRSRRCRPVLYKYSFAHIKYYGRFFLIDVDHISYFVKMAHFS